MWREGEVEERKKGRKRPRECLAWALAEGTKSQGVHGPVDPSTSVKVFENAITLPLSFFFFFFRKSIFFFFFVVNFVIH